MTFTDLRGGMQARVVKLDYSVSGTKRLEELGLTIGTEFVVLKVAPFGDPIEIEFRGYRICVRRTEAQGIVLEPIPCS